ncbi:hypothetical protein R3W88_020210 [Solanum pinnatisectum]|uniref:Uncharacterized protein n=1 Tax=Solanum pinnatisectum TaxID=50273 RepID=A0AAV9KMD3_9SOLN|nr:hypothetical protein R3W88_020210 [Solanum pinnatisectum]
MSITKKKSNLIFALMLLLTLSANLSNSERLTFKVVSQQGISSTGDGSSYILPMLPRGPSPPSGANPSPPYALLHKDQYTSPPKN